MNFGRGEMSRYEGAIVEEGDLQCNKKTVEKSWKRSINHFSAYKNGFNLRDHHIPMTNFIL